MKCPKCGYLGFEHVERCRNCGYEFSLVSEPDAPELPMRGQADAGAPLPELELFAVAGGRGSAEALQPTPDWGPVLPASAPPAPSRELTLFGSALADDAPLITKASPPRTPLAVRRATPDVPRLRSTPPRTPMLDLTGVDREGEPRPHTGRRASVAVPGVPDPEPAGLAARFAAVAMDMAILAGVDAAVIYFTMKICGLSPQDLGILPKGPLLAFLLVQNGGYLATFNAGGQTIGKMIARIRVVSSRSGGALDLGHSLLRTMVWAALAAPAGLGFATAFFSRDHRGLHDRCAGTRVVRASAA